jgi:2-polyprenyl-6-methoxyphenol hydroxylase-like FAD-dependent oxidoreductase
MKRQTFMTSRGRTLADWHLDESVYGVQPVNVVRGELHEVLFAAVGDVVHLGAPVEGFTQDGDGVVVHGPAGEERFDVLVGADGLRSAIRAQVVGDGEPLYAGYTTWITILPSDEPLVRNWMRVFFGKGVRFVAWSVSGGRVYWETIARAPEGGADPEGGARAAVLELLGDFVEPVPRLVEAALPERVYRSDAYARPFAPSWGEGRVTMIGDAAHAMTNAVGQGANQAMEDAVVLARCLAGTTDPVAALRRYEELRRERTEAFVKRSRTVARMALVRGPVAVVGRNAMMKAMNRVAFRAQTKDAAYDADAVVV